MNAVVSETVGVASACHISKPEKIPGTGEFSGKAVKNLIDYLLSDKTTEISLGMAAFNSLTNKDNDDFQKGDILLWAGQHFKGANVGLIGHFPFAPEIKTWAANCQIIEKNPSPGDLHGKTAKQYLNCYDLVIITGMTILNDSLDEVLESCPRAFKIMLGPTVPLHNKLLDYGVNVLCSMISLDEQPFFDSICEGSAVAQFKACVSAVIAREKLELPAGDFRPRVLKIIKEGKNHENSE